mmetsp:Transcript_36505/g.91730  ORF Transcript_36505/g.91730 Transcript_36505/m.91730 type:complete len:262 (-) Transcript_36505:401-1186(-)
MGATRATGTLVPPPRQSLQTANPEFWHEAQPTSLSDQRWQMQGTRPVPWQVLHLSVFWLLRSCSSASSRLNQIAPIAKPAAEASWESVPKPGPLSMAPHPVAAPNAMVWPDPTPARRRRGVANSRLAEGARTEVEDGRTERPEVVAKASMLTQSRASEGLWGTGKGRATVSEREGEGRRAGGFWAAGDIYIYIYIKYGKQKTCTILGPHAAARNSSTAYSACRDCNRGRVWKCGNSGCRELGTAIAVHARFHLWSNETSGR